MKSRLSICLIVIMIVLVGCQSNPTAKNFSVTVAAPKELKADELFIVKGTLVNHSDNSWDVLHGADMFTYDVFDSNGDRVSQGIEPIMFEGLVQVMSSR